MPRALLALILLAATIGAPSLWAETAAAFSIQQLSDVSTLVVMGRVLSVSSQWDPAVSGLYTYATIEIDETWKGEVTDRRIVVKLLGGKVDDLELRVDGQAKLATTEHVLLWLEVRPRDRTLYPAGMWQGVWRIRGRAGSRFDRLIALHRSKLQGHQPFVHGVSGRIPGGRPIHLSAVRRSARPLARSGPRNTRPR